MSKLLTGQRAHEPKQGDSVSFMNEDSRIKGVIVRIVEAPILYHVEVDECRRYEVNAINDEMQWAERD